jgi:hypothetical protein
MVVYYYFDLLISREAGYQRLVFAQSKRPASHHNPPESQHHERIPQGRNQAAGASWLSLIEIENTLILQIMNSFCGTALLR